MMNENLDRKVQVAKADVELSRGHLDRLDEIDNAVYQMCQVLTEDEDLPWSMEYIGEIADFAAELLVKCGYKVRFPCIVEEDGEEHIEEYVKLLGDEDCSNICKETPVYRYDMEYARRHNDISEYRKSLSANIACQRAIEKAISENYNANRLNAGAALEAIREEFRADRIEYVLANTVQLKNYDGRFGLSNKRWAANIDVCQDSSFEIDEVNPGLVDLLISHLRREHH